MLTWTILQHVAWEGPGLIAAEARARGLPVDVRRIDQGDAVPNVQDVAGLIVMGGPMGVYDTEAYPHLIDEQRLLRMAVARDLPVLGVCLGAQLLAAALGARVYKGPAPEIGAGEVALTPDGLVDPVVGGSKPALPVVHWHGDTFELPAGAVHLARTALYPHQAFRAGRSAYGFQFHVEVDRELAAAWTPRLPPDTRLDDATRTQIEATGRRILGRFIDRALDR